MNVEIYMKESNQENVNMEKSGGRSKKIDVLKGIGILMMVAGHMHFSDAVFNKYVYAFHMPLFFLISGYLYHRPSSFKDAVLHKAKSLLIPYFVFGIGYSVLWCVRAGKDIHSIGDSLMALLLKGTDGIYVEVALWFLLSSFITYNVFLLIDLYVITSVQWKVIIVTAFTLTGCVATPYLFKFIGGGIA